MTARDSKGRFVKAPPPLHLQPGDRLPFPHETQLPPAWLPISIIVMMAVVIGVGLWKFAVS